MKFLCNDCIVKSAIQIILNSGSPYIESELVVMHRRTLCENVDSAKIKVPFYTTDVHILRVGSMHRIVHTSY